MNTPLNQSYPPSRQQGVALVVSLVLLIVLTLLGLSAMDSTIIETRMASNNQERNYAFHAAEAGLVQGIPASSSATQLSNLMNNFNANLAEVRIVRGQNDASEDMESVSSNVQMEYKGRFPPPRTPAGAAWSQSKTDMVYFETQASGRNIDNGPVNIDLRSGMRQGAPKP